MAFTYKLEAKTVRPSSPNLPQRCAELGSRRHDRCRPRSEAERDDAGWDRGLSRSLEWRLRYTRLDEGTDGAPSPCS